MKLSAFVLLIVVSLVSSASAQSAANCSGVVCSNLAECVTSGSFSYCVCKDNFVGSGANCIERIELQGAYFSNFGSNNVQEIFIGSFGYLSGSGSFSFVEVNNQENFFIAKNGPDNHYNPNLYSKFYWVNEDEEGSAFVCQQVFDATTIEIAEAAAAPNFTDPLKSGCGSLSFPWTKIKSEKTASDVPGSSCDDIELSNVKFAFVVIGTFLGGFLLAALIVTLMSKRSASSPNLTTGKIEQYETSEIRA
eukprot:Nk52_evm37s226 gene=Nk52_evmTU37s226